MSSAWVGIDPGVRGAIAVIDSHGEWHVIDMPKQGSSGAMTVTCLLDSVRINHVHRSVAIEQQRAYGGQGVVSSCALGQAYGWICGVVDAWASGTVAIVERPLPQAWQTAVIGRRMKGGPPAKERALAVAAEAAPNIALQTPRGRVLDGRADAICIALYAKQQWEV